MSVRNWRDWFVEEDETPVHVQSDLADVESGSRHKDFDRLELGKRPTPRCAKCKRYMGYDDGMYVVISGDWRIHIRCFSSVLERHFENGEAIDLTTGNIIEVEVTE